MRALIVLTFFALAACGADGAPEPKGDAGTSGITVTGSASIGVSGSF
ncbi:hypothetical protein N9L47_02490 [Rhodobacteraceae bacterium]|nr:hypothetical protein [Paracoccaceae bacterium]